MKIVKQLTSLISAGALLATLGCSAERDVEVTGEVRAASTVQATIVLEFFDLREGDEKVSVHTAELAAPGAFSEKISAEGEKISVRAIADADGDGKCSAGELWAEVQGDISEQDKVEGLELQLSQQACPAD
jgi:hypothetical protein